MRRWLVRVMIGCLAWSAMGGLAAALTFDQNPILGDRQVSLTWTPGEDDPIFTGNLRLYHLGDTLAAPGAIRFTSFTRSGSHIWLWDDLEHRFLGYKVSRDSLSLVYQLDPLAQGDEPVSFALHPEGILLLAGMADGRIMAWRPELSPNAYEYEGHMGGCNGMAFMPLAGDIDSSFVSVGEDGYWRQWARPGVLQHEVPADQPGPLTAVAVSRFGDVVAAGSQEGLIGIYLISASSPRATPDGHQGRAISGLTFSSDGNRLASADAEGGVRIWGTELGELIGGSDDAAAQGVRIVYTPRESRYIAFCRDDGTLGLIDGFTGMPYETTGELDRPITSFALSSDGSTGYFGDGDGLLEWWYLGACVPSERTPECFGGYIVWRGLYPHPDSLQILRIYNFADTSWGWTSFDTTRSFVDPDSILRRGGDLDLPVAGPHNGIPYYYSLTRYSWNFLDGGIFRVRRDTRDEGFYRDLPEAGGEISEIPPTALMPRVDAISAPPYLRDVYVVPNPYIETEDTSHFGPLTPPMVQFYNLPESATLRIYTASGDLVRTLRHDPDSGNRSGGARAWYLKSDYGADVSSGVYLYAVEAHGGESTRGFFTIIR